MPKPGAVGLLLVLVAVPGPLRAEAEDAAPDRARAAFAALKALAGEWDARSTQGWQGVQVLQVIARGSALLSTSRVEPHAGGDEAMATLFHLDGDRFMLTHYCVAGNQPRLVATAISDDGRRIEFAFRDGTNLRSRDDGHMDRAVFVLESPDRYRSRWTFYRDGKESWMEEIVHTRRR